MGYCAEGVLKVNNTADENKNIEEENIPAGVDMDEKPEILKEKLPKEETAEENQMPSETEIAEEESSFFKKMLYGYYDILDSLVFATIATMLVFFLVGRTAMIDGSSMYPTLQDGERVVLVTAFYTPKAGDLIVATRPGNVFEPVAKRIIATEGQTVFIDFIEGAVYVDGQKLDEPYTNSPTNLDEGVQFPVTVPPGSVFVLGDNRNNSLDSRSPRIGFVDKRNIVGEIVYRVSPFEKIEK